MAGGNHLSVTEFVLLGFTALQELPFVISILIYIAVLVGNLRMIILIRTNSQLHMPMQFFLSHLSFLDTCCSSSITPKLLLGLLAERNVVSFNGCITYFFAVFGTTEAVLLAVAVYDHYVAIREPLHLLAATSHGVCVPLVVGSCAARSLNALVHTSALLQLSFWGPKLVNHFYCGIPLLPLPSCSDTWFNETATAACGGFIITPSVLAIVVSCACILLTNHNIRSAEGRHKAFSTGVSHFVAAALSYSFAACLYFHPFSRRAEDQGKTASFFYAAVMPMLNPFIYSLRSTEVRSTLRRATNELPPACIPTGPALPKRKQISPAAVESAEEIRLTQEHCTFLHIW